MTNRQYRRWRVTAQSTWRKSVASIADAWVCRNCSQVASVRRSGAGGIFRALRTRRIVDAPTRWPSLSSSPWILLYPVPLENRIRLVSCRSSVRQAACVIRSLRDLLCVDVGHGGAGNVRVAVGDVLCDALARLGRVVVRL